MMDQEPDIGPEPLPPPTREEEEGEAWEYWHQRAVNLECVVHDMLAGLAYLRATNRVPYGFGIDRLETTGRAAIAKVGPRPLSSTIRTEP